MKTINFLIYFLLFQVGLIHSSWPFIACTIYLQGRQETVTSRAQDINQHGRTLVVLKNTKNVISPLVSAGQKGWKCLMAISSCEVVCPRQPTVVTLHALR